eukprot:TRINITY_DN20168_c0_g1_i2.p1 TRINITY_DN20168_c0_g1~~TRINITY_DN20168_c0_g1_i2.p1  ORF type:complete len:216 (-),score=-21.01 TRINITY_DN20168_c0_g1_i2:77-724(-)
MKSNQKNTGLFRKNIQNQKNSGCLFKTQSSQLNQMPYKFQHIFCYSSTMSDVRIQTNYIVQFCKDTICSIVTLHYSTNIQLPRKNTKLQLIYVVNTAVMCNKEIQDTHFFFYKCIKIKFYFPQKSTLFGKYSYRQQKVREMITKLLVQRRNSSTNVQKQLLFSCNNGQQKINLSILSLVQRRNMLIFNHFYQFLTRAHHIQIQQLYLVTFQQGIW